MKTVKITKRSLVKFQFGDSEPEITLDVIEVADQWHEVNFALRILKDDMWIVPADKVNEFAVNRLNFVQSVVNSAYVEKPAPTLSRIEAEEFIVLMQREVEELRNFTSPTNGATLSAPENTAEVGDLSSFQ